MTPLNSSPANLVLNRQIENPMGQQQTSLLSLEQQQTFLLSLEHKLFLGNMLKKAHQNYTTFKKTFGKNFN